MSDLYIKTRGKGRRHIVLLHGWAMHGGIFAPLIEPLTDMATLHVVDLPGHGRSRDSRIPLTLSDCVQAIAENTPAATWLGWSMGGQIALEAALTRPDKVRSLAVISSSPCLVEKPGWAFGRPAAVFARFGEALVHHYHDTLKRFLELEAMGSPRAHTQSRALQSVFQQGDPAPRVLEEGLALINQTDLRYKLESLDMPSVWLAGARDRMIPWQAMEWASQLCHGHFSSIDHAGHAAFIGFTEQVVAALQPLFVPGKVSL